MTTSDEAIQTQIFEWIYSRNVGALKAFLEGGGGKEASLSEMHRGQTPLTLAISLGLSEAVEILLAAGASPLQRNAAGWSPFQEATSFGSRQDMARVFSARRSRLSTWFDKGGSGWAILQCLSEMTGNFCAEIEWSLRSAVPYLSRLCPSVRLFLCEWINHPWTLILTLSTP